MKTPTRPGKGHNSEAVDTPSANNGEELRSFLERVERIAAEQKDLADAVKEVFAEANGRGYDVKILRKLLAMRKRDKDDLDEEDAILELYKAALGM